MVQPTKEFNSICETIDMKKTNIKIQIWTETGRINLRLLQLYMTHYSILVTVRLYTVVPEMCCWLTNEKQRKIDIRLTDQ